MQSCFDLEIQYKFQVRYLYQNTNIINHKQQQAMFRSRLLKLTTYFAAFSKRTIPKKSGSMSQKLALIACSLFFVPKYIYNSQEPSDAAQQSAKEAKGPSIEKDQPHKEQNKIIYHIQTEKDVENLSLQGNILIWFQKTGIDYIDDQVTQMLYLFVQTNKDHINTCFKIIIDSTSRSRPVSQSGKYFKKQVGLMILKPDDMVSIPLSKHLSYQGTNDFSYTNIFQRLIQQINIYPEVSSSNIYNFAQSLGQKPHQSCILINALNKDGKSIKAARQLKKFIQDKTAITPNTTKAVITDEHSMRYLGIDQESQNPISILLPDSENIKKPGKVITIHGRKYHLYKPSNIQESVVFSPYIVTSSQDSLILKVVVDMNHNVSQNLMSLYQDFAKTQSPQLSGIPKVLVFSNTDSIPIQLYLQKNNFDSIVNAYQPGSRFSAEEKRKLIFQGNKWKYGEKELNLSDIETWVKSVLNQKIEPTFESEPEQVSNIKAYNSTRITGQQYMQILSANTQKPKVVFHYSQHCFSCKKFKHIYEEIAGQKRDRFNFYRIDNDFNRSKGLRNYNSTPVFVIYQKGVPYFYKNTIFTKSMFEDFLDITNNLKTFDQALLEKGVQQRAKAEFKLSEFL